MVTRLSVKILFLEKDTLNTENSDTEKLITDTENRLADTVPGSWQLPGPVPAFGYSVSVYSQDVMYADKSRSDCL